MNNSSFTFVCRALILTVAAVLTLVSGCDQGPNPPISSAPHASPAKPQLQKLRVQFGWLFDAHHAGFLIAKAKGYYASENLDVELLPGGLDSSPIRSVVTGGAEVGQVSGGEQVIAARQEKLPITAFAAFHRKSPHALISTERLPITSPSDLRGKTVAVAFGDAAELYFRDLLRSANLTEKDVSIVPFRFNLTPLIEGKVDAVTGFSTDQPFTLESKGLKPITFSYAVAGKLGYGYMFVATTDFLSRHVDLFRRFVRASRKGWDDAFAAPGATVELIKKHFIPSLDTAIEVKKLKALRPIMLDEKQHLASWVIDADVLRAAAGRMQAYQGLKDAPDIETMFDNVAVGTLDELKR